MLCVKRWSRKCGGKTDGGPTVEWRTRVNDRERVAVRSVKAPPIEETTKLSQQTQRERR